MLIERLVARKNQVCAHNDLRLSVQTSRGVVSVFKTSSELSTSGQTGAAPLSTKSSTPVQQCRLRAHHHPFTPFTDCSTSHILIDTFILPLTSESSRTNSPTLVRSRHPQT